MSKFTMITRFNKMFNKEERYLQTLGKVITISTEGEVTKINKKDFGYFKANIAGKVSEGIAYKAVVGDRDIKPGDEILFEALAEDLEAGVNNHWRIALVNCDPLADEITAFLNANKVS